MLHQRKEFNLYKYTGLSSTLSCEGHCAPCCWLAMNPAFSPAPWTSQPLLQHCRNFHALRNQCTAKCFQPTLPHKTAPSRSLSQGPVVKKSGNCSVPLTVIKRNAFTDSKTQLQDKSKQVEQRLNSSSPWRTLSTITDTSRYLAGNARHTLAQDLTTFLLEVGTAGKEARFWLKQFQQSLTHHDQPFAVVHIDYDVFKNDADVVRVGKCLSFLQRNGMKPIVVLGYSSPAPSSGDGENQLWATINDTETVSPEKLQEIIFELNSHVVSIVNAIEDDGALCRPMFYGTAMLQADECPAYGARGSLRSLDERAVQWCLSSSHLPVIPSIGLSSTGQLLVLDPYQVTAELTRKFMPVKVLFLNEAGGLRDESGTIIANINLPNQLDEYLHKSWCSKQLKYRLLSVHQLLCNLPSTSSVIVTSACTVLKELFTHQGSGTFFKNTESILSYRSLSEVDSARLTSLINTGFGLTLDEDYFTRLDGSISTIYVSQSYSAAAIITQEPGMDVPYLDKFVVSKQTQGQGTSEILWAHLKRDFPRLFWRSRNIKSVTPWYFKRAEGSWTQGEWTVFWYGVPDVKKSQLLIEYALARPQSFTGSPEPQPTKPTPLLHEVSGKETSLRTEPATSDLSSNTKPPSAEPAPPVEVKG